MGRPAPAPELAAPAGRRKLALVAEQFVPPVNDGSTYVYKSWVDFLAERYELYAIFFASRPGETAQAERYLAARCAAYLILPGPPASRLWKVVRAAARMVSGTLLAPRWIEELGRARIHRTIADFVAAHRIDLFMISKLACVPLFGERNIRRMSAAFLLDMHDDFILRDTQERAVLARLLKAFPALSAYPKYRDMRLRQSLSRLSRERARRQEQRLYRYFRCLLTSSPDEDRFYRAACGRRVACEFVGWPPQLSQSEIAAQRVGPSFDAGFLGGDFPFNLEAVLFFCTDILPLIHRRRPTFRVLIAGQVTAPLALIARNWPGVELWGYIARADEFYGSVRLCIAPMLSGTGTSIKTLEALEAGKPVVATRVGARGIAAGRAGLVIADAPEEFASRLVAQNWAAPTATAVSPPGAGAFQSLFDDVLRRHAGTPRDRITSDRQCSGRFSRQADDDAGAARWHRNKGGEAP